MQRMMRHFLQEEPRERRLGQRDTENLSRDITAAVSGTYEAFPGLFHYTFHSRRRVAGASQGLWVRHSHTQGRLGRKEEALSVSP